MSGVEWASPEPPRAGPAAGISRKIVVAELKANPGRWALVRKSAPSAAPSEFWKEAGMEVKIRSAGKTEQGKRLYDIYARWNGTPDLTAIEEQRIDGDVQNADLIYLSLETLIAEVRGLRVEVKELTQAAKDKG